MGGMVGRGNVMRIMKINDDCISVELLDIPWRDLSKT